MAQALLGKRLVRLLDGQRLAGTIVETEAYCDAAEPDLACHGTRNRGRPTARTQIMFGPAGHAYIYFTYGMHWMTNIITGRDGQANGVLLRALEPVEGAAVMAQHRTDRPRREWTNGPGKLSQALAIDKTLNGAYLYRPDSVLWVEDATPIPPDVIRRGPRIGLGQTPEPWFSIPWRDWIEGNTFVSPQKQIDHGR